MPEMQWKMNPSESFLKGNWDQKFVIGTRFFFLLEHLNFGWGWMCLFFWGFSASGVLIDVLNRNSNKKARKNLFDKDPCPFHLKKRFIATYDKFETKGFITNYPRHFFYSKCQ